MKIKQNLTKDEKLRLFLLCYAIFLLVMFFISEKDYADIYWCLLMASICLDWFVEKERKWLVLLSASAVFCVLASYKYLVLVGVIK